MNAACCVSLLLLVSALPAVAACSRPLSVGLSSVGYTTYVENGQPKGVVPELAKLLEARTGCSLVLALRPRARVMQEYATGSLDILSSQLRTTERDKTGLYLQYGYARFDLVITPALRGQIGSLADLERRAGATVGVMRGITHGPELEAWLVRAQAAHRVEQGKDYENLAARLMAGRIQAALIPSISHAKLIADGLLDGEAGIVDLPESELLPVGIYLNAKTVADADRQVLQQHMRQLLNEGQAEKLYAKFLGADGARRLFKAHAKAGK